MACMYMFVANVYRQDHDDFKCFTRLDFCALYMVYTTVHMFIIFTVYSFSTYLLFSSL